MTARETELRDRLQVMADLADEAATVISNLDDGHCHGLLVEQLLAAIRAVRMDDVDIDAIHR